MNPTDDRTRTLPGLAQAPARGDTPDAPLGERASAVVGSVRPEEPRRHPVAYLALALSVIALLWLAVGSGSDDDYQRVRVGSQDCVSVPQESGPAVLYCRTSVTIK